MSDIYIPEVFLTYGSKSALCSVVSNCYEAAAFIHDKIGKGLVERFILLCMDYDYHPINYSILSIGNSDKIVVDLGELFRISLLCGAKRILVAHNHLGSSLEPTESDIKTTKMIGSVSRMLDIELIDSMIVINDGDWISIRKYVMENGL